MNLFIICESVILYVFFIFITRAMIHCVNFKNDENIPEIFSIGWPLLFIATICIFINRKIRYIVDSFDNFIKNKLNKDEIIIEDNNSYLSQGDLPSWHPYRNKINCKCDCHKS